MTTLDFAVGNGGNGYFDDATQLDLTIVNTGTGGSDGGSDGGSTTTFTSDLSGDFSATSNPNAEWAYGWSSNSAPAGFRLDSRAADFGNGVDQYVSSIQYLSIWHNRTSSPIVSGPITFAPGTGGPPPRPLG